MKATTKKMGFGKPLPVSTVAVGTQNPAKIRAAAGAVSQVWPEAVCQGCSVSSGVSEQPTTEHDAIRGATNRACRALLALDADLGIGLEGYTAETPHGMFLSAWVAIVHHQDMDPQSGRAAHVGLGSGGRILMPESLADEVRGGAELGPVMDRWMDRKNTKQHEGAVGILTNGLVEREEALTYGVLYALASFVSPLAYV